MYVYVAVCMYVYVAVIYLYHKRVNHVLEVSAYKTNEKEESNVGLSGTRVFAMVKFEKNLPL